jgi:hypothetical protein
MCCILRGPGGEHIVDVVPGGTELKLHIVSYSFAVHEQEYRAVLLINTELTAEP